MKKRLKELLLRLLAVFVRDDRPKIVYYHDVGTRYTDMGTTSGLFWSHMVLLRLGDRVCFDDGFRGIWDERSEFRRRGIKPTVFIAIALVGRPGHLTWDEIRILQDEFGFDFQSHTWSHQTLSGSYIVESQVESRTDAWYERELLSSRVELERRLGKKVTGLCFPAGHFSKDVIERAARAGYCELYTSIPGRVLPVAVPTGARLVCRHLVQNVSLNVFKCVLRGALNPLRARYLKQHFSSTCLLMFLFGLPVCAAEAETIPFELSRYFYSEWMLQRDVPNKIWGRVTPGKVVSARFGGIRATAEPADADGNWMLEFPPLEASADERSMVFSVDGVDTKAVSGIVVGDIWLCAGQSNMERPLSESYDWQAYEKDAIGTVRSITVPLNAADTPQRDIFGGYWRKQTTIPSEIPAVPYYFARALVKGGVTVPIGIVTVAAGGKRIECFMSPGMVSFDISLSNQVATTVGNGNVRGFQHWNGMFEPIKNATFAGCIWYQGESDATACQTEENYERLLTIFINGMRKCWGAKLPFYIVQLASCYAWNDMPEGEDGYPQVREAQRQVASSVGNSGLAVAVDLFATDSHPRAKVLVGDRLARLALQDLYGKNIMTSGPAVTSATCLGNQIRICFSENTIGRGLVLGCKDWRDNAAPEVAEQVGIKTNLNGFAVSADNVTWHWADGYIATDNSVVVSNLECKTPRYVHYAQVSSAVGWDNNGPELLAGGVNLYNVTWDDVLLPAIPFATIRATPAVAGFPGPRVNWIPRDPPPPVEDPPPDDKPPEEGDVPSGVDTGEDPDPGEEPILEPEEKIVDSYDKISYGGAVFSSIGDAYQALKSHPDEWVILTKGNAFLSACQVGNIVPVFYGGKDIRAVSIVGNSVLITIQNAIQGVSYGVSRNSDLKLPFDEPGSWVTAPSSGVLRLSVPINQGDSGCFMRVKAR